MLIKYPNKILLTPSEDVTLEEGLEIEKLLRDSIKNECTWGNCVGLAAPQIGLNKNVFIALDILYINPKILWSSPGMWATFKEGCYSLPENASYDVRRALNVRMEWTNRKGEIKSASFAQFPAEVVQHEYDHLLGKLCCGENI